MTATAIEKDMAELRAMGASLGEAVAALKKGLDAPDYSALRPHAGKDGGVFGYWEPEGKIKTRVRPDGRHRELPRSLPPGYKNECWKSAGQFYRELIRSPVEFRQKHASITKAIQGMTTQVASDGGAWILPEFSDQIIDHVYANDLWSRTDGYTVGGNNLTFKANAETSRVNGSRHGGLRGYWTAEGATITDSQPRTRDVALKLNKCAVVVYLTDELIEDAGPALEQYVTRKATEEFEFLLGDSLFNGTGVGQPLGILNAPGLLSISKETGQAATTIVTENIDKMWARRNDGGAFTWFTTQDTDTQLQALTQDVGTGGVVLNRPNGGISAPSTTGLKGAPRIDTEFNATLGTVGDIALVDFGQYLTISKGGIAQAVSMHVEFLTDQTALRFTMRVDGRPGWVSPITPFKGSNTQAFFLVLATRS